MDEDSPHHGASHEWLSSALNGERRVGLPWLSLGAFVRIVTNPRASRNPLSPSDAWGFVEEWLDCDVAWIPGPTSNHAAVLGRLIRQYDLRANMITDAQLAALAVEHGLAVYSRRHRLRPLLRDHLDQSGRVTGPVASPSGASFDRRPQRVKTRRF